MLVMSALYQPEYLDRILVYVFQKHLIVFVLEYVLLHLVLHLSILMVII